MRDRIDQVRTSHSTVVLAQVLSGGGGVGKTQLAAAYAHQALADGIDLVVWIDASDIDHVIARYAHAAHCVGAAREDPSGKGAESSAAQFLQWLATARQPWLVVLDDLTDPEAMQAWWPPSSAFGCGRVLATTRRHEAILSGGGRAVVDVATYSAKEAETYLRERLHSARAAHLLDSHVAELIKALGYLPLALSHAAAYMINEDVSCSDYLHRFNDSTARLDELLPRDADTEGYGREVASALLLSLDVAQASEPFGLAVPALRLAAVLDPAGHPRSLWATSAVTGYLEAHRTAPSPEDHVSTATGPAEAQAALRLLHRYGLLTDQAQAGSRAVRIHAITARAVCEYTPDDVTPAVVAAAVGALTEVCKRVPRSDHETKSVLRANIEKLDGSAGDLLWQVDGHYLLLWAVRSLFEEGLGAATIAYAQRLAGISERLLGRAHLMTLVARRDLAWGFFLTHRHEDAYAILQDDFPHHDRSLAQESLGDPAEASEHAYVLTLMKDTLTIRERLLGPEHPAALACRVDLATTLWTHGDQSAATALLKRCLFDYQSTLGPNHRDTVSVSDRLQTWRAERRRLRWRLGRRSPSPADEG
ncbi:tetratricopeptide repeat protein [Actinacidiphila glaucinigra]|uniref:tetratricopeptide repeat protein n=1 Tax=Actinacidiphila glaucinigra TaxID=235986 RepID=UPI00324B6C84